MINVIGELIGTFQHNCEIDTIFRRFCAGCAWGGCHPGKQLGVVEIILICRGAK